MRDAIRNLRAETDAAFADLSGQIKYECPSGDMYAAWARLERAVEAERAIMKPDLSTLARGIRMYFEHRNIPAEGLTVIIQVPAAGAAARIDHAVADEAAELIGTQHYPTLGARTFEIEGVKFLIAAPHGDE
jgi:hypothetical protein